MTSATNPVGIYASRSVIREALEPILEDEKSFFKGSDKEKVIDAVTEIFEDKTFSTEKTSVMEQLTKVIVGIVDVGLVTSGTVSDCRAQIRLIAETLIQQCTLKPELVRAKREAAAEAAAEAARAAAGEIMRDPEAARSAAKAAAEAAREAADRLINPTPTVTVKLDTAELERYQQRFQQPVEAQKTEKPGPGFFERLFGPRKK